MTTTRATVRLGTRGSALARWQTTHVQELLHAVYPQFDLQVHLIITHGDRVLDTPLPLVGGKGLFTAELEAALHSHAIDLAVHSLKDLPTTPAPGLAVGAVLDRGNPADALVSRQGYTLQTLPTGATVGTSSRRRAAQMLAQRSDLHIIDIRGNVDTRLRKALDPAGPYDAIILACAGLERLENQRLISQVLSFEHMLPAPGQGALAIQCRDEATALALLAPLNHPETALAITAERAFLEGMGGGCAVPIAAYASLAQGQLSLQGRITALDGSTQLSVSATAVLGEGAGSDMAAARHLGLTLAQTALAQGAAALLEARP
jgi:hydroxymethylbilane synthase